MRPSEPKDAFSQLKECPAHMDVYPFSPTMDRLSFEFVMRHCFKSMCFTYAFLEWLMLWFCLFIGRLTLGSHVDAMPVVYTVFWIHQPGQLQAIARMCNISALTYMYIYAFLLVQQRQEMEMECKRLKNPSRNLHGGPQATSNSHPCPSFLFGQILPFRFFLVFIVTRSQFWKEFTLEIWEGKSIPWCNFFP